MTYMITSPKASTSVSSSVLQVELKPVSTLETIFAAALEHARRLTDMYDTQNIAVILAWETVEELGGAITLQQSSTQAAFDRYCAANPEAPESRMTFKVYP